MSEPLFLLIKSAFDATGITAATNSINRMDGQIARVTKGLSKFTGLLAGGAAGAAALAFLGKTYDAYRESEKAVNLFTKAYQNLGNFSRQQIQDQIDLAQRLQKTTKYTDEQILAIQTQLVTYGLYGDELSKATIATLDLAVKTGSAESAAKLMGKAYQGQTDTLSRYGIKIDSNLKGSARYAAVLHEVDARLGGLAATEGEALGSTDKLAKSMDELYEKIGALVKGPLGDFVNLLIQIVDVIPKVSQAVYDGDVKLSKTDGTLKTVFKTVWNGINPFKALSGAAEEATKAMMGIKPLPEPKAEKPGKPKLQTPGGKDEDWEKFMSPEQQGKRLEAVMKDQRRQLEMMRDYDDFVLTERGLAYTRFFGKTAMESRRNAIAQSNNAEEMKVRQEKVLKDLERAYAAAGRTFSGGWTQALDEMEQSMGDWKDSWSQVMSGGIAPTQAAIKDFFDFSSENFGNLGTLAEKAFKGIRDAFYDMIMQMAAKAAVYGFLNFVSGGSFGTAMGGMKSFVTRAAGGPIPGPEGSPMPILAHGGEFVLSANVVKAIKAGQPTSGISGGTAAAISGGSSATIYQTFQVSGGGDVKETLKAIARAARNGTTEALDAAKVLYKQGAKRSGETAL